MFFSACMRPTINKSALAAFCVFNRRLPFSIPRRHHLYPQFHTISSNDVLVVPSSLSLSQQSNSNDESSIGDYTSGIPISSPSSSSASPSDKDWLSEGREAARKLKLELGIMSEDDDDDDESNANMKNKELDSTKFEVSSAILESGRAAARELLKNMNTDDLESDEVGDQAKDDDNKEKTTMQPTTLSSDNILQAKPKKTNWPRPYIVPPPVEEEVDYFNIKSRKEHYLTIALVPPPSANQAWEQLMTLRRECTDPGFYRWPPHVNLLYPFLDMTLNKKSKEPYEVQLSKFRNEISNHLEIAARQCKPFDVTLDSFGTFGGRARAVLWAYPKTKYTTTQQPCDDDEEGEEEEPLIALQRFLEEQFPKCTEQRKGGTFNPHMTVSHYPNIDFATAAKEEVEAKWNPISFHVAEVYLLERKGNGGQFKVLATIPLGADSKVELHDPPKAFPGMPTIEDDWVKARRKSVKKRAKRNMTKKERRGGYQTKKGTPQEIPKNPEKFLKE